MLVQFGLTYIDGFYWFEVGSKGPFVFLKDNCDKHSYFGSAVMVLSICKCTTIWSKASKPIETTPFAAFPRTERWISCASLLPPRWFPLWMLFRFGFLLTGFPPKTAPFFNLGHTTAETKRIPKAHFGFHLRSWGRYPETQGTGVRPPLFGLGTLLRGESEEVEC